MEINYYLLTKDILDGNAENYDEILEKWENENLEIYERITQILALKQSCYLMRRVSYSCGTLSDGLVENYEYPFCD